MLKSQEMRYSHHIVMCANERYSPGLEITIKTILEIAHCSNEIDFHIIDAGLAKSTVTRLQRLFDKSRHYRIRWISAPFERFENLVLINYHISSYLRLTIPELVDSSHILYIDADALPLANPCLAYSLTDSAKHALTAVSDRETHSPVQDSMEIAHARGLEECLTYFNAGVVGMNLSELRAMDFTSQAIDFLRELGQHATYGDQSVLNALLWNRWEEVPATWNTPAWVFDEQIDNQLPGILHYTNSAPWLQRHYRPSQALYERLAHELGVVLPKPEKGLLRTMPVAIGKWLVAPARVAWHGLKSARASRKGDAKMTTGERHIMRHWWRYFSGGPARVLRYHRRIREIKSPDFKIFDRG